MIESPKITQYINDGSYEKELRRLGWCIDCQGYGQDWEDGSNCKNCNGTGKFSYESIINE
jgi:hypothetical protein